MQRRLCLRCELRTKLRCFIKNSVKIILVEENLIKWQRSIDGRQLSSLAGLYLSQQNIESSVGHAMEFLRDREMYRII